MHILVLHESMFFPPPSFVFSFDVQLKGVQCIATSRDKHKANDMKHYTDRVLLHLHRTVMFASCGVINTVCCYINTVLLY